MASEDSGSGSPRNRPIPTRNDTEMSDSQLQPPRRTSTELVLDTGLALGTELVLDTAVVLEPDNIGDNAAPPRVEQHNPSRRARIQEQPQPIDVTAAREAEPLPEGTSIVRTDTSLASRRGHGRAGAGSGMPLPPLPVPVAVPGSRAGGQPLVRPRSIYSPRSQRSDPFSDSPTSRSAPHRLSGSPLSHSQDALPLVSPWVAETHDHAPGVSRTQQSSSRNNAPRPRLQKQESERDILIDQLLRQNEQYRAELGFQFANAFAEDNADEGSPGDNPGDLDDDLEAQRRRRIRQPEDPRSLRTVNVEGPIPIATREDNMQRRTPATDDAGVLGAQAAGEILYSITRVDNTQPHHEQSANTKRDMGDGIKQSRTTGPRFTTARSFIDDLVPLRPPSDSSRKLENDAATYMAGSITSRLSATLHDAESERDKYTRKAKYTGWALNIAIGLQVLLGSLTTGLSAVATRGKSAAVATTILGALATLVASYLARARGSNEPELSITRVKDLEQFIRECRNFEKDYGEDMTNKYQPVVDRFRERFESLLGNANGERKLSASGGAFQRDVAVGRY